MLSGDYSNNIHSTRLLFRVTPDQGYWKASFHQLLLDDSGILTVLGDRSISTPNIQAVEPNTSSAAVGAWYFRHRCSTPEPGQVILSRSRQIPSPRVSPLKGHRQYWFCDRFPSCGCDQTFIYQYTFMYIVPIN